MSTTPTGPAPASPPSFARRDLIVVVAFPRRRQCGRGNDSRLQRPDCGPDRQHDPSRRFPCQGRFATGFYAAVSVIGYMAGAGVGELVIVRRRDSASWLSPFGWALVAELVALSGLLVSWRLAGANPAVGTSAGLVAFAAVAMGIQSAAVLRLHVGPTTIYVTGTLTTFMTETIRRLPLVETAPARTPEVQASGSSILSPNGPVLYGIVWLVYAGGACVSGLLFLRVREAALALPIIAIVAAIAVGVRRR